MSDPTAGKSPSDYQHELASLTGPPNGNSAEMCMRGVVMDKIYEKSEFTRSLGTGAEEFVTTFDSSTELFKAMNADAEWLTAPLAGDLTGPNLYSATHPCKVIAKLRYPRPELITDCGISGKPKFFLGKAKDNFLKLPAEITGNWTPQIKRGHYKIVDNKTTTPSVVLTAIKASTQCDPTATGPIGGQGINLQTEYLINVSSLYEILCTTEISVIKILSHSGTDTYLPVNPRTTGMYILEAGPTITRMPQNHNGIVSDPTSGASTLPSIIGGVQIRYLSKFGPYYNTLDLMSVVNSDTQLECQIQFIDIGTVTDHKAGTAAPGSWTDYGVSGNTTKTVGLTATSMGGTCTVGVTLSGGGTSTVDADVPATGEALRWALFANQIAIDSSFSANCTLSGLNGVATFSGSVRVYRTCSDPYLKIQISGSFAGTMQPSDCGQIPACTVLGVNNSDDILGTATSQIGSISTPWSSVRYLVMLRCDAAFSCFAGVSAPKLPRMSMIAQAYLQRS